MGPSFLNSVWIKFLSSSFSESFFFFKDENEKYLKNGSKFLFQEVKWKKLINTIVLLFRQPNKTDY